MVDRSDLAKIGQLYDEIRQIEAGLANFDRGGVITAFTVSPGPLDAPVPPVAPGEPMPIAISVPGIGIVYPSGMVDAIKAALEARRNAIEDELAGFGVTGIEGR